MKYFKITICTFLIGLLFSSCEKDEIGDFYIGITNTYDFSIAISMDGVDLSRVELSPGQSSYGNAAPGTYTVSARVTGDDPNNEFPSNASVTKNFIEDGNYGWIAGEPDVEYFGNVNEPSDPVDPNSGGNGSGGNGGNGSGGNGGNGGGANCDNLNYNGPTEGQIMQFCQAAQLYECLGATTEQDYVCDVIASYGASCPYCN
ncbi:hypothetical protein ULMS_25510 [Patiriisocius marinistellae]|uniref:Uncharacterized protein n=1 Tax=Patiriisocius marinistellae TaxID=2494560 RepID=A0A5J4FYC3_9FLAO|nr:hypothetical protein [Patiriisocius marinistellae]GEQ87043.1 hypothetical protein ULMS_25510 [Patiriisocius marinistellae]